MCARFGAREDVTAPAPSLESDGYSLPSARGVQWLVNGHPKNAGFHPLQTEKERRRLVVSAVSTDKNTYCVSGATSWVLRARTHVDASGSARNSFSWGPDRKMGEGWTGPMSPGGDFDSNGSKDILRITPKGVLVAYLTVGESRLQWPARELEGGWQGTRILAGGVDLTGDDHPDVLALQENGSLLFAAGDGAGGLVTKPAPLAGEWGTAKLFTVGPDPAPLEGEGAPRKTARVLFAGDDGRVFARQVQPNTEFAAAQEVGTLDMGVRAIYGQDDWNHDGTADLLALTDDGRLMLYPGEGAGFSEPVFVSDGWESTKSLIPMAGPNENILWTQDSTDVVWRRSNTQSGHIPTGGDFDTSLGYNLSGARFLAEFNYAYSHREKDLGQEVNPDGTPIIKVEGLEGGKPIFHPLAHARFVLGNCENSISTFDDERRKEYVRRAVATGELMLSKAIVHEDELWFPYSFDYEAMHHSENTLPNPWFSSMAQGYALAAFVRLEQVTGDWKWRAAADQVLAGYYARPGDPYWFAQVDPDGYLWLEEYPGSTFQTKVINGHLFSVDGLSYYWLHTHNEEVNLLADGAITAVEAGFNDFRVPGNPSAYCAGLFCWAQQFRPMDYHKIVSNQLRDLTRLTGQTRFTELADTLKQDAWEE